MIIDISYHLDDDGYDVLKGAGKKGVVILYIKP